MNRLPTRAFFILSFFSLLGCGGATFRTGESWDPKESAFFDDGVDVFDDYSAISGQWAYRLEKELDARLQLADFIGVAKILSVQTKSDFEVEAAKRIDIEIVEALYGNTPGNNVQLVSTREAPGHQLILRYEGRLTGNQLVFIRWFEKEDKSLGHHFHISPASEYLVSKVRPVIANRIREESVSN